MASQVAPRGNGVSGGGRRRGVNGGYGYDAEHARRATPTDVTGTSRD